MKTIKWISAIVGIAALAGCTTYDDKMSADKQNMAHVHIGHVLTGWSGTPGDKGLLPTAIAEANIAIQHAGFAVKKPKDLKWLKAHTGHVLHAVAPDKIAKGPGMGYGVIKAATGVAQHIEFAAGSEGASKNVKTHAVHVATSARNTVARAERIAKLSQLVQKTDNVADAAQLAKQIQHAAKQLLKGANADGVKPITWHKGEGGLTVVQKHMGFMTKGEGM